MAGGSLAVLPAIQDSSFLSSASSMQVHDSDTKGKWFLNNEKGECIVYNETSDAVKVDLLRYPGSYKVKWINATNGSMLEQSESITGGKVIDIVPPNKNVVMWLTRN